MVEARRRFLSLALVGAVLVGVACSASPSGVFVADDGGADEGGSVDPNADAAAPALCGPGTTQCGARCVDVNVDPANCGACGKACPAGQVCSNGTCSLTCTGGTTKCGDVCVDTKSDPKNCGGCGGGDGSATVCGVGLVCNMGKCALECGPGLVACNGACIDPMTNRQYCGASGGCGVGDAGSAGAQCTAGQICTGGACEASCLPTQILCNGQCIDPMTSNEFCGATAGCGASGLGSAGTACGPGEVCSAGACGATCGAPLTKCEPSGAPSYCADTQNDPANCNTCGNACPAVPNGIPVCTGGSCTYACAGNTVDCNPLAQDGCEDLQTDAANCGTCGNACPAGFRCGAGKCVPTCAHLVTNAPVWGLSAKGIALSAFTNGTLDWIGCPGDGCAPSSFFCTDEPTGMRFGTTASGGEGVLRALLDPGNAAGDTYPTSHFGCCTNALPRSVCNAPMTNNNGVGGLNAGDALCKAMGFSSGTVVSEVASNVCPKPHATAADGSNWTSTFAPLGGYGREYLCTF